MPDSGLSKGRGLEDVPSAARATASSSSPHRPIAHAGRSDVISPDDARRILEDLKDLQPLKDLAYR